jgi:single-strand DNA-binding protein
MGSRSHNRIILIGNLGRDADIRYTPAGKAVASTSLAIDDPAKKNPDGGPATEWYRLKIWGKTAESLKQFLVRGKQVYVEGRLSIQTWTDREGHNRYTPEVTVDRVLLLGSAGAQGAAAAEHAAPAVDEAEQTPEEITEDDIPF